MMKFSIFQESRCGARPYNQDRVAYSYSREALLLVVADGMGGHAHGEIAAQISVELLTDCFQKQANPALDNPHQFMIDACQQAHYAILSYAVKHQLADTPRTTCVVAIIQKDTLYWAHIGDSRLYLVRAGKQILRTKDHSRVQQLIDIGQISEKEAERHPDKNKIYNCLGSMFEPEATLGGGMPLCDGDTVLLCTDGLWSEVTQSELVQTLSAYPVFYALPQLLDSAERHGGVRGDNLSAIATNWHSQQASSDSTMEPIVVDRPQPTEVDVDAAIREINSVLEKYTPKS